MKGFLPFFTLISMFVYFQSSFSQELQSSPGLTERPFITTWKTDNNGISENNQIRIPTILDEIYDYRVDWGDGTSTENVIGDITHTYDVPGTYTVSISGEFAGLYFNKTGDKDKLLEVVQWGDIRWTSLNSAFNGCTNLDVLAMDLPDFGSVFDYRSAFQDCASLIGNSSFNDWDVGNALGAAFMFKGATLFNQDISNWTFGTMMVMDGMFEDAVSFNQPVDFGGFGRTPTMTNMFRGAASFDQDLSEMPSAGSDMSGMLVGSGMSTENYDKTLIGWASSTGRRVDENVIFDVGEVQFCLGEEARQKLIDDYGWVITDGGIAAECLGLDCADALANEDLAIVLPNGGLMSGADGVTGTSSNTNGSDCAIEVSNTDASQPWAKYHIPIVLADYGMEPGDRIFIGVDGNDGSGNARFEINQENRANTSLGFPNFGSAWSRYETTVVVPSGISSLDLWFHSNYTLRDNGGTAFYDNLTVVNFDLDEGIINGSREFVPSNTMLLAPNPAISTVTIAFEEAINVEEYLIFDIMGRLIKTVTATQIEGQQIEVSDLPAGTYFVRTMNSTGEQFQKQMVIKR